MVQASRAALLTLLVLCAVPAVAQEANGGDFAVNAYTTGRQGTPDIAADESGHFVVAWAGAGEGDPDGVFARRFTSAGVPRGPEFRVNTDTTASLGYGVAVSSDRFGNFVVVWTSDGQDGSSYGIFGQRFAADGSPIGAEFQVNTYTTGMQSDGSVALDDAGNFVVVWEENPARDGGPRTIFGRRYDASARFRSGVQGERLYRRVRVGGEGRDCERRIVRRRVGW